jgi:hypothetical protein
VIMKMISLKLPEFLLLRLKEEAKDRRVSKSKVVRDCLEQRLFKPKRGKKPSCHDLARKWAGALRGPRDIATNSDYLNDFGR